MTWKEFVFRLGTMAAGTFLFGFGLGLTDSPAWIVRFLGCLGGIVGLFAVAFAWGWRQLR